MKQLLLLAATFLSAAQQSSANNAVVHRKLLASVSASDASPRYLKGNKKKRDNNTDFDDNEESHGFDEVFDDEEVGYALVAVPDEEVVSNNEMWAELDGEELGGELLDDDEFDKEELDEDELDEDELDEDEFDEEELLHDVDSDNEVWAELVEEEPAFEAIVATQYRAADGCVQPNESQVNTCLASSLSYSLGVNCCSGTMGNNLKCSRPGCKKRTTFDGARKVCANYGMRVCSFAEVDSGACCNKGCGFNDQNTWTSTSCSTTDSSNKTPTSKPTNEPTKNPTPLPTERPTSKPTNEPTSTTGTLSTFNGERSTATSKNTIGLMIEVIAQKDVGITSFSTLFGTATETWTEIWTRQGGYQQYTKNNQGWKRIYMKSSQQYGSASPTELILEGTPVYIKKGESASFYFVSPGQINSLDAANAKDEGEVTAQDSSIMLLAGTALDYDRWENGCTNGRECVFPQRSFEGTISYVADIVITNEPTAQPTPDPNKKLSSGLTVRENQWLEGHNTRRKKYHEQYGKSYVPLQWSFALRDMAQQYADELASNCGPTVHSSYAARGYYGENLASNSGMDEGYGSWGELKPVDKIMIRFVEREENWAPPENYHFSQVLWRASKFVGCADSKGTQPNGAVCRYQVCRYARTGNCNVSSYNDGSKQWWMKPILRDTSPCGPPCPPDKPNC